MPVVFKRDYGSNIWRKRKTILVCFVVFSSIDIIIGISGLHKYLFQNIVFMALYIAFGICAMVFFFLTIYIILLYEARKILHKQIEDESHNTLQ